MPKRLVRTPTSVEVVERHLQSEADAEIRVRHQHGAGRRQKAHAIAPGQRQHGEGLGGKDQMRVLQDPDDTGLAEHPIYQTILRGHGSGVGNGCMSASLCGTSL